MGTFKGILATAKEIEKGREVVEGLSQDYSKTKFLPCGTPWTLLCVAAMFVCGIVIIFSLCFHQFLQ